MNFGASDILALSKFAFDVARACKNSGKDYQGLRDDVTALAVIIREINDLLKQDKSSLTMRREKDLTDLLNTAKRTLTDLEQELKTYGDMDTLRQTKFEILRFAIAKVSDFRQRVTATTTSLTALEASLAAHSSTFIKRLLVKYVREVHNLDIHDGSSISTHTPDSVKSKAAWKDIQEELKAIGICDSVIIERRAFILETLKKAIEENLAASAAGSSTAVIDSEAEVDVTELQRRETMSTLVEKVDREYDQKVEKRVKHAKDIREFKDLDIRKLRKHDGRYNSRKLSPFVARILRKLGLASDERLIEAADENELTKVIRLLDNGANVKAQDKWRWTALHMAAYGGYDDIAAVLTDRGALLDARTVDGETPLTLAERSGHWRVVKVIMDKLDQIQVESDLAKEEERLERRRQKRRALGLGEDDGDDDEKDDEQVKTEMMRVLEMASEENRADSDKIGGIGAADVEIVTVETA